MSGRLDVEGEPSTVPRARAGSGGARPGGENDAQPWPEEGPPPRGRRDDERRMPFLEHLEELRRVVFDMLWGIALGAVAGWFLSERALEILVRPVGHLVYFGPAEGLSLQLKVAFGIGLVIASPFLLWRLWAFVAPGLLRTERRVVGPLVASSALLFLAGVLFAQQVLAPLTLRFLLSFQSEALTPMLAAGPYFDFLFKLCFAFGAFFQLPIVLGGLAWVGVLPPRLLLGRWREAVMVIFIIAAVFTPPDIVSQLVMAGPLLVLYVISIGVAYALAGRRRRAAAPRNDGAASPPGPEAP